MSTIRILLADSQFLSRKGLAVILKQYTDFEVVAEAVSAAELLEKTALFQPDLIILDYSGIQFNLDAIKRVRSEHPDLSILAITDFQPNSSISKALEAGVTSHLLKDCEEEEILEAIYKTMEGQRFLCGKIAGPLADEQKLGVDAYSCEGLNISDREAEIIKLIAEGLSNKEVADKLFLSTHTVTTHRKNIMNKLGVNNTAGLVLFAVRENLISPNHFLFAGN